MSQARIEKRQKADGVEFFNRLLMEFINVFNDNSLFRKGQALTRDYVWDELQRIDNEWKRFCHNVRHSHKRVIKFEPGALIRESEKHIGRMKEAAWTGYVPGLYKETYGHTCTVADARKFYKADRDPEYGAMMILLDQTKSETLMHTAEIPAINVKINIPEAIDEMSRSQYVHFAGELARLMGKEITLQDFRTSMVLKLLGVKYDSREYRKLSAEGRLMAAENVNRIAALCDYFFAQNEKGELTLNLSCIKNLIPFFSRRLIRYRGPADGLTDISFLEYKDANNYFLQYLRSWDVKDLDRLIAVLYRPVWFRRKKKYDPGKVEKRAVRISRIPMGVKFGIYLFYAGCEKYLKEGTFMADQCEVNLKLLYETTPKEERLRKKEKYPENTGLTGLAYSLAQTGIFGNVEKVFGQNLYDVLVLLYKHRIEYLNQLESIPE